MEVIKRSNYKELKYWFECECGTTFTCDDSECSVTNFNRFYHCPDCRNEIIGSEIT